MTTGFHTSAAGMIWTQKSMDVTANNIANLSTQGYKNDEASFADLLYTQIKPPQTDPALTVGHGSRLDKTDTIFTASGLDQTGRPQDYALTDDRTFFAVRTTDGRTIYTRGGNFSLSKGVDGQFPSCGLRWEPGSRGRRKPHPYNRPESKTGSRRLHFPRP